MLVPIAVALIVGNGLSPTAVLLPPALLYLANAWIYGLPLPAQPLKAFGAIAIAEGLGADEIAAGALLIGSLFLVAGRLGLLDRAARAFPRALIRGVQLTVGLLFLRIAWGLVTDPPQAFADHAIPTGMGRRPRGRDGRVRPRAEAAGGGARARRDRRRGGRGSDGRRGALRALAARLPEHRPRDARGRLHRPRPPPGPALLRQLDPRHHRCGAHLLREGRGEGAAARARHDLRLREPLRRRDQRHAGLPRRGRA